MLFILLTETIFHHKKITIVPPVDEVLLSCWLRFPLRGRRRAAGLDAGDGLDPAEGGGHPGSTNYNIK